MPEKDIIQSMSFDAAQALKTLDLLDKNFAKFGGTLRGPVADGIKAFNATSNQADLAAKRIYNSFDKNLGKGAVESVERLTVSWGLLSRVVTTQLIVSEFGRLRRALGDAAKDSIAYQNQLAEIETISDRAFVSTQQLSDSVVRFSNAWNQGLDSSASAVYETLSSQVATSSEEIDRFVNASGAFAVGSVTKLDTSVELLAGTLNAFERSADQADDVAAKFFRTIDLGNVTGSQLAISFNRNSASANALGISFEELAAATSVLTRRGLQHAEASTAIRGTMIGLTKPTQELSKVIEDLGFANSKTLIQTLGYGGALRALVESTDGSIEGLAKLFPRVRGINAVLQIGSQAAGDYASDLAKISAETAATNRSKALEVLSNDANTLTKELNALRNALTTGIGSDIVSFGANLTRLGLSADNVTTAIEATAPVLTTGAGLLGLYAAAALRGATANATFVSSFKGISAGLLLGAAAAGGGNLIGDALINAFEAPQKEFDRIQRLRIDNFRDAEAERLKILRESNKDLVQEALRGIQDLNKVYLQDFNNAKAANQNLLNDAERTLAGIVSARERYTDALRKAAADTQQIAQDSASRVVDLQFNLDDRRFDRQLAGLDEARQVFALTNRANELASQAARQLTEAGRTGDRDAIQRSQQLFSRADAAGAEAEAIAQRVGNRQLEARAAKTVDSIIRDQINSERQLQALQADRRRALENEANRQAAIAAELRTQTQIILQNTSLFDEAGKLFSDDQQADRLAKRQAALQRVVDLGLKQSDLSAADALGLAKLAGDFAHTLSQSPVDLQFRIDNGIEALKARLTGAFRDFTLDLPFDLSRLETILGRELTTPTQAIDGLGEAADNAANLQEQFSKLAVDQANVDRLRANVLGIAAVTDDASRAYLRLLGVNGQSNRQTVAQVSAIRNEFVRLANDTQITDDEISSLLQRLSDLRGQALQGNVAKNTGLALDLRDFSTALGLLKQQADLQEEIANNPANAPGANIKLDRINSFLQTLKNSETSAANMASSFERSANAAERVQRALGNPTVSVQGFATGGLARGTDTIPAMLSPGEFVVNAQSSKQFFSQLQAINAGFSPQYRSEGGVVNNTTVGDVHVYAAENPRATANEVIRQINRAQRRGSSRIK